MCFLLLLVDQFAFLFARHVTAQCHDDGGEPEQANDRDDTHIANCDRDLSPHAKIMWYLCRPPTGHPRLWKRKVLKDTDGKRNDRPKDLDFFFGDGHCDEGEVIRRTEGFEKWMMLLWYFYRIVRIHT